MLVTLLMVTIDSYVTIHILKKYEIISVFLEIN